VTEVELRVEQLYDDGVVIGECILAEWVKITWEAQNHPAGLQLLIALASHPLNTVDAGRQQEHLLRQAVNALRGRAVLEVPQR
jgi:hypothetical protein